LNPDVAPDLEKELAATRALDAADAKRSQRNAKLVAFRIGVLVLFFAAWWGASGTLVDKFFLPSPVKVVQELRDWVTSGSLLEHVLATLLPGIKGFLIATAAAFLLGYALAMARFASEVFEPYITALYGIPIISLVPLLILWFGIGSELAVAVAVLASFFLMFYNVYFGIREVSSVLIDQVLIAGGSAWDIAWRVRLPSALVWVVAGMKVALPHSIVGVVVAEFLTGNKGVGYLLASNANQFNAAGTFAAVIVLASMSFIMDRLLSRLTSRALIWKEANRQ
jgi:NitT/TauT family transport system permease protein